ncbi:rab effector MyRIP isoform X2 [Parambassis ranga]|uniref:Rab effector MyRIP isoform X2 n=1 Tax=Parambassis ranga TaxID=210632 RepID=A0A6P7K0T2_9TELE|nr:rab effector MyRIP-like isoform X2 [Parambassis ranga]
MGRKLDLSGLTDNEAEHVLQVVQRDMRLRKKEEERLSELKQELDEEGSRSLLLSRQSCFNQRCCIRCCSPFTFLFNPKRQCQDCRYNVCKACRVYNKREKAWLCSVCQKSRLLKTQSLEWYYTNVKKRFKRFGSAKVLKTFYRKHLAEHSALSELTEGGACEESIYNEGSICGSDSTFYRQTEEHSMAETLTVAMRVAEEAIDEAISKAEIDTSSQEKQNEAHYLREHRGELIEELAKTIVQKIISRRKSLAEMRAEYDHDWPLEHNTDPHHHQSACDQASSSLKHQSNLWRSHSAFSLLDNDPPGLIQDSTHTLKKEGCVSAVTAWKSVDRLDNAVLKSPDGNWIALQSAQLSRPSLLTKRKSLVYSALERESGVVSAYEGLGSDNESKPEPDSSWGAALQEIHRKMTDSNFNFYDTGDRSPSLPMGRRGSRDGLSDSEGNWKPNKPLLALLKKKVPAEIRKPSSSRRTSIIDVNFNLEGAGGQEEMKVAAELEVGKVKRSRKKRRSRKQRAASSSASDLDKNDQDSLHPSDAATPDTQTSGATTPEPFDPPGIEANQMNEEITNTQQTSGRVSDSSTREEGLNEQEDAGDSCEREEDRQGSIDGVEEDESLWKMEIDLEGGRTEDEEDKEVDDEEMRYRLYRLVAQSRLTYFSSTDDELDRAGQSEGEWDRYEDMEEDRKQEEEKAEGLAYQLCQLEKEVRATQFSSTEDELDRIGRREEEEEEGKNEDLALKVCRLASQIDATQFSSTEDELDRAGKEGEEAMDEEPLWKLQAEKAVQAASLRDLACLVSASQFSSTEDELDRAGQKEGKSKQEVVEGETESSVEMEELWEGAEGRRESIGEIDVKMFDLRNDSEESDLNSQTKPEDVQQDETLQQDDVIEKRHKCDERVEDSKGGEEEKEPEELLETELKTTEAERAEEIITLHESQPEAKREDKFTELKDSQGRWETVADSEEEDTEFNRIISSMLMMTLEDMQVETKNNAAERDRELVEVEMDKMEAEIGFGSEAVKVQSTEETGSVSDEFQFDDRRPEGAQGEGAREDTPGKQEGEYVLGDGHTIALKENSAEANVATLTHKRSDTDEEEHGGGGKMAADTKTSGDAADSEKETVEERLDGTKEEDAGDAEQSSSSSLHEDLLSPEEIHNDRDMELCNTIEFISTLLEQRYSAVSLRSITTEVLKVLNATEELLQGVGGDDTQLFTTTLPPNTDPKKMDQQFSRMEENVYMAAGSVYSLEAELSDLEECARGICSSTSDMELSFLEEQVAAAAAKVQQSELQISDISARIAALKCAGLDVDPQSRFFKSRTIPVMPATLDSSRQQRRRLPAPPVKEEKET